MLDIMHDMNQEAIQQSMLAFDAVEDEMYAAHLAQQAQEDGFQEYLESPQVLAEGIAFELYHGEVELNPQLCSCCGKPVNDWCDDAGMCIACVHDE